MGGKNAAQSVRASNRAIEQLRSLESRAEHFGHTFDYVLAELKQIRETTLKGHSRAAHAHFRGYWEAISHGWYAHKLCFVHQAPDGKLYTLHKAAIKSGREARMAGHETGIALFHDGDEIYKAGRGAEMSLWPATHFWTKTGKRYGDWSAAGGGTMSHDPEMVGKDDAAAGGDPYENARGPYSPLQTGPNGKLVAEIGDEGPVIIHPSYPA